MSFLDIIKRANTANLDDYLPLWIDNEPVGLIWRRNISLLRDYGFAVQESVLGLEWHDFKNLARNSEYLLDICQRMAKDGLILGWRNESFALCQHLHSKVHALVERAALPYFGACGYGVHINGLTKRDNQTHMWLAKRALNKPTAPGKLDQIAAGGLPYGLSPFENMIKECQEEAYIPAEIAQQAIHVGTVSYLRQTDIGIRSDIMFNYDLWLADDFEPIAHDGEVAEFICLPIQNIMQLLLETKDIKFNSALVIIDFLIRHGYITPNEEKYAQICALLRQREIRLSTWLENNFLNR